MYPPTHVGGTKCEVRAEYVRVPTKLYATCASRTTGEAKVQHTLPVSNDGEYQYTKGWMLVRIPNFCAASERPSEDNGTHNSFG